MSILQDSVARLAGWRSWARLVPLLLSLLALPLVAAGRAGYSFEVAARWVWAAVVTGYEDARGATRAR